MTKPSYEELERLLVAEKGKFVEWCLSDQMRFRSFRENKERAEKAEAENLRVRGLLQRVTEIANGSQTWIDRVNAIVELLESGNCRLCGKPLSDELHQADKDLLACSTHGEYDYHKFTQADSPTFPQSSSLVSQGAESADIGKLDAAEKSGWEAVIRAEDGNTTVLAVNILRLWPREQIERFAKHLLGDAAQAGSAETGGEKAAPEVTMTRADDGTPRFLWFSGKYYTIPEALLKAIRAGSREPEKLNNAQKENE